MELAHIDHGRPFDWGRASADYARWRDIYPPEFFRPLTERALAARDGLDIDFRCAAAEDCRFPDGSFDTATACQCFTYFNHARLAPGSTGCSSPAGFSRCCTWPGCRERILWRGRVRR